MNTVKDNFISSKDMITITSGSFGEGLEMRGSDFDVMHVSTSTEVIEDEKTRLHPSILLRMETDDVKPGFTQLVLKSNSFQIFQHCEVHNGKHYVSSTLFKHYLLDNKDDEKDDYIIHGPCLADKAGQFDSLFCFQCKTWISQASQWISRSNNSWPSYNVKQSILKHGVLFVPIGVKGSPTEDIEWRISFSVGEKMLVSTFTHAQLLCYALMKILLKDVIASYTECADLLCSYFVKTIIFWVSEELPKSVWKPENLIDCFMHCFSRLIYCVNYSVCLHYFIPENNMFEYKIEGRTREILLNKLYTLQSYGWRCVLFSDQLSNFHVSIRMNHIKPHKLHAIEVAKTLSSKLTFISNVLKEPYAKKTTYSYKRKIHQIVCCDQTSLKYIYTYYLSVSCARFAQAIPLDSTRSNKHQYKQYNSCLCNLLQNVYHDSVSGWLMIASFFYKTKQYNKALHILEYSLSKCTPEKLYYFMDMSDSHYQLLELKSFQEKSIVRLWKTMLVDFIKFDRNSCLIPNELQMEVENGPCNISSIVYAYFLKLLCHYHFNDVRQYQDCLTTLILVADTYCIEKIEEFQVRYYNILGIAFQLLGDHNAARIAFKQSFEISPSHIFNTSYKRLSLMTSL
ncbi:uncharacterized protein LOC143043747 [Mytilus galloprovincialis]|uniref:uncharacterized protein LOC143043747 n=1 Tax=Mytilus galloprovincialis TaxID=29158 RepID=UPI003F7C636D